MEAVWKEKSKRTKDIREIKEKKVSEIKNEKMRKKWIRKKEAFLYFTPA